MPLPLSKPVPAPSALDTVQQHILVGFAEMVDGLGGDTAMLLRDAGIDPDDFAIGKANVTYRQAVELVALAGIRLHCPDFGMRLARFQAGSFHSPLLEIMETARTLGEALQEISTHSNAHSPAAAIWLGELPTADNIMVGHDILLEGLPDRAQAMEQILLIAYLSIRDVVGGTLRAVRIHFRHQPISPLGIYRRHFGCEIRFGQRADGIILHRRDLARPTVRPDENAFRAAIAWIETQNYPHPPLHAKVRGSIMHLLGTDLCTNAYISSTIALHVRAMHRGLAAEGTSFQRIKTEIRCELALYYLEHTRLDLATVSERLGFAEQSALTYFCRKWLNRSPRAIRNSAFWKAPVQNQQV